MDFYEKTLQELEELLKEERYREAEKIFEEELSMAYIPRDFEEKLLELKKKLPVRQESTDLSEDKIREYLFDRPEKQLLAVSLLDKKNLRDLLPLCEEFLSSEKGYLNAKVLLVDSLIRQEIGEEVKMTDETAEYIFIPKYLLLPEESDGFLSGMAYLEKAFLKEPSKLYMARDLLYKEVMLKLPVNLEKEEGDYLGKKIEEYIKKAFEEGERE